MGLKVIQLNACGKFSTGNIARNIARKVGNGSKLFYVNNAVDDPNARRFYNKRRWYLDLLMTRVVGLDSIWSGQNTRAIIREIKREKPDILHLHNLHGFFLNYKTLFRFIKKNGIKVVWTLHDCWSFTGHCPHFDFVGCEKWKTQCKRCPLFKQSYLKSWYFDRSSKGYRLKKQFFCGVKDLTIVTPSHWLADLVKQSFLREYPVQVINNGIDLEMFEICESVTFRDVLPKGKKIILAVASDWGEMKGYSDIVELSRRLSDDYAVVMVGVTEMQKAELEREKIIALMRTDNQRQLAELYSSAYVFVNTTYEETYPTVNMEALCCGCPVITYATGGSVESINESTGLVIPKGDIDALMTAINSIQFKCYNREKISQDARAVYSQEDMLDKYVALYEDILGQQD